MGKVSPSELFARHNPSDVNAPYSTETQELGQKAFDTPVSKQGFLGRGKPKPVVVPPTPPILKNVEDQVRAVNRGEAAQMTKKGKSKPKQETQSDPVSDAVKQEAELDFWSTVITAGSFAAGIAILYWISQSLP